MEQPQPSVPGLQETATAANAKLEDTPVDDPIIQSIIGCGRLTFEDETGVRHQLTLAQAPRFSVERIISHRSLAVASAVLCTTGGGIYCWYGGVSGSTNIFHNIQVGVAKFLPTVVAMGGLGICVHKIAERSLIQQVKDILGLLHETSLLTRKVLKWVLDNEVLRRGYTLAASSEPQSRGSVLSLKACLRLRRSAFIESRVMVFVLRAVAVDLLKLLSAEKLLDPLENHICLIALEEFGDSLSIPESDLEALYLSTDGFSLQATKSLIGLFDLQVSEFLKLLCSHRLNCAGPISDISLLRRLKTANKLVLEAFRRMQLEYKFETDEPLTMMSELGSSRRLSSLGGSRNGAPPDYLRSLELHLTAALKDLRAVIGDGDPMTADELQKVTQQDRLEKLGYHVKCTTMLLDHMKRKSLVCDQTPSTEDAPTVSPTLSDFEIRPVVTAEDIVKVEDEIFEALVLEDADAEHRSEPMFVELNNYQQQRLQSTMVLEEIKTILSVRSADWKERERKARVRKGLPTGDADLNNGDTMIVSDSENLSKIYQELEEEDPVPRLPISESDMATVAAAVASRWKATAEEQFGSSESESETP